MAFSNMSGRFLHGTSYNDGPIVRLDTPAANEPPKPRVYAPPSPELQAYQKSVAEFQGDGMSQKKAAQAEELSAKFQSYL